MTVDDIIDDIIRREGGFVDHPADRGGPTKYGITQATLAEWRGHPVTIEDVKALTVEEARRIYRALYIEKPGLAALPEPLRGLVVDTAVHSGVKTAVRLLQKALGVPAMDGILGPATMAAVRNTNAAWLYRKMLAERIRYLGEVITARPANAVFAKGWMERVAEFVENSPPTTQN
jgi:lysozyme family protein